jgi:EmrB/QacA subfamily drug resistance transporter
MQMAVFLAAIDVTIITTAVPEISEHFHSTAGYTWIGSAFLLGSSAATPLWGKVSDVFGRKPVLLLANLVFFAGSTIAGASISITMLIAGRAIQGVGGGGLVTLVNICIGDLFSLKKRGAYYGIIGGVWAIASALGPVVGGAFTQRVSWRWCFYINLPLDGAAFLIILFFLDIQTPKTPIWDGLKAIDWIGAIAVIGGTLMFLLGLQFGGQSYPWSSATVICLLVFGVFAWLLFFFNEWKLAIYPVMPLRLFQKRTTLACLGVCFIHGMVFIAGSYFLPLYFQAILGATPLLSGVYLLPTALSLSFASAGTGVIIRKTGHYRPLIWAGMFLLTVGTGLFINLAPNSSWAKIILYQIVSGVGIGPNFQAPLIAMQSHVSPRDIATATATFGFIRNLATAISVVIGGVVFQNEMKKHAGMLVQALGPQTARQLGGANAGANVEVVRQLPPTQRAVARQAFAESLSKMWIMYTVFAFVGLLIALLIARKQLSATHQETKTGLEGERERREEAAREREERRRKSSQLGPKRGSGVANGNSVDLEKGNGTEDKETR